MALPPALLQFVEQHGCFSGCYGSNSNLKAFTAATQPPFPMVSVSCLDCLGHVGVLASLLPKGMDSYQLADDLSQHVRLSRGYSLSLSGYHANGPGFWLSAVYWASCNLFLLDGERSRKLGTDLELLMLAFKHKVLKPPTPAMLNPNSFTTQSLFLDERQAMPIVAAKVDLLSAPGVSMQPTRGWKKVTLAEFVPTPTQATTVDSQSSGPSQGQRCSKCGAEIRQRALLNQTFIGCLC